MIAKQITFRCPKCRTQREGKRLDEFDPEDADIIEIICPQCDDGDFHAPVYFNTQGNEMPWHKLTGEEQYDG
jgi:hypothetical protein